MVLQLAHFIRLLGLQGGVLNAQGMKGLSCLFAHGTKRLQVLRINDQVHTEHGVCAVEAPGMLVVHIAHMFDGQQGVAHGKGVDTFRVTLHEDTRAYAQGADGVPGDEQADGDGQQRVDDGPTGVTDHQGAHQDGGPAEHILQQMQVGTALVERLSAMEFPGGKPVHQQPEDRDRHHAHRVRHLRNEQAGHSVHGHQHGTDEKDPGAQPATQHPVPAVAIAVPCIPFAPGKLHEVPGQTEHEAIAQVVQCIGEHGDAVRPPATNGFDQGEGRVDEERGAQCLGAATVLRMAMSMLVIRRMCVAHGTNVGSEGGAYLGGMDTTNNQPSAVARIGSSIKRTVLKLLLVALALFICFMLFIYYASYSSGVRSGVVIKLSERGMVFKTWEGQVNLQSFGALDDKGNAMNEVFSFSVEGGNDSLVKQLEDVSLSGERVNLHYVERYAKLPWRGETKYFVNRVERSGQKVEMDRSPYAH